LPQWLELGLGGFAVKGGLTQPPTSPREYMDLRAGPGSAEQVELTHLLQRLHWIDVRPSSREQRNKDIWD